MLDAVTIGIVAFSILFMIGGLIFVHYGNKASEKMQQEEMKKEKQGLEEIKKQRNK